MVSEMERTLKDSSQRRTFVTSIEKEIPARRYKQEWRDHAATDSLPHEVRNCAAARLMPVAIVPDSDEASSSVGDRSSFVSTSTATSGEETHVEEERVVTRYRDTPL